MVYCAQIYQNKPAVLDEVINILFYIAEADGAVSQKELEMIERNYFLED